MKQTTLICYKRTVLQFNPEWVNAGKGKEKLNASCTIRCIAFYALSTLEMDSSGINYKKYMPS